MKRIFIVEDDVHIGNMLEEALKGEGYAVSRAYSGTEALLALAQRKPDLVLLDLMLPGLDGEEVLRAIKDLPVIVVSAKADVGSKVELLQGGAVDYVTKPFDMRELLARISVHLRNASGMGKIEFLEFAQIRLDTGTREVWIGEQAVRLTRTEYAILKLLLQNPLQIFSKSMLLDHISADTPDCTESSLKTHISHLRAKLQEAGGKDYIETVWGIGFRLKKD